MQQQQQQQALEHDRNAVGRTAALYASDRCLTHKYSLVAAFFYVRCFVLADLVVLSCTVTYLMHFGLQPCARQLLGRQISISLRTAHHVAFEHFFITPDK